MTIHRQTTTPGIQAVRSKSIAQYLKSAAYQLVRRPARCMLSACIVVAAAMPLYMLQYHEGALPTVGLVISVGLGVYVNLLLVGQSIVSQGQRISKHGRRSVLIVSIALATGATLVIVVAMNAVLSLVGVFPEAVLVVANNHSSFFWKPVVHVTFGSAVLFSIAPLSLLTIPLCMRFDLEWNEAARIVEKRIQDIHYSWLAAAVSMLAITTTLALIPVLCLVVPAYLATLCETMYRDIFSTRQ